MTDTNVFAENAHTMSANSNLEQRRKQEQASCVDGKLTAAEVRAASDTNSFTQVGSKTVNRRGSKSKTAVRTMELQLRWEQR